MKVLKLIIIDSRVYVPRYKTIINLISKSSVRRIKWNFRLGNFVLINSKYQTGSVQGDSVSF